MKKTFMLLLMVTVAMTTHLAEARTRDADLALTLLAPASVDVSDPIAVQLVVYNHGPKRAKNTTVTLSLPANVGVNSLASECYLSGSDIICDMGTLRRNRQHTSSIELQAPGNGGNVLLAASVTSNRNDPNPSNNNAQASITVNAPPPPPPPSVAVVINTPQQVDFTACWTDPYDNLPASFNDCQAPAEAGSMTLNANNNSVTTGDPGVIGTWSQPTPETLQINFTDLNYNPLSVWRGTGVSSSCWTGDIEFISAVAEAAWQGCVVP